MKNKRVSLAQMTHIAGLDGIVPTIPMCPRGDTALCVQECNLLVVIVCIFFIFFFNFDFHVIELYVFVFLCYIILLFSLFLVPFLLF